MLNDIANKNYENMNQWLKNSSSWPKDSNEPGIWQKSRPLPAHSINANSHWSAISNSAYC